LLAINAVLGEQGVQERADHTLLWGPSVEGQRSGDVVSYLHQLGAARQKVQDPIAQGGVETHGLSLMRASSLSWTGGRAKAKVGVTQVSYYSD
jgi:hypothetical protein